MTIVFTVQQYPDDPSCNRLLLSDCQILDEHFRTCSYILSVIPLKVDFPQDLDGNGEIGLEEVSFGIIRSQHETNNHSSSSPCGIMSR